MVLKFGVINLLLAVILSFMVMKSYFVWNSDFEIPATPAQQQGIKQPSDNLNASQKISTSPRSAYDDIDRRNLFSETRRDVIPVVENANEIVAVENKINGKEIRLYGVILLKDRKKALISNPEKSSDASSLLWIQQGEKIGSLKVVSIEETAVVFSEGEERYRILLYDKNKMRSPVTQSASMSSMPNIVTTTSSKNEQKAPEVVPAVKENRTSKDGSENIKTPFGEMKRRKTESYEKKN
jgi:hypothetical protein